MLELCKCTNKNSKTQIIIYTSACGQANEPVVTFILIEIQIQLDFECFTRTSNESLDHFI